MRRPEWGDSSPLSCPGSNEEGVVRKPVGQTIKFCTIFLRCLEQEPCLQKMELLQNAQCIFAWAVFWQMEAWRQVMELGGLGGMLFCKPATQVR